MAGVTAILEKKGIPSVCEIVDIPAIKQIAKLNYLVNGVPEARSVFIPQNRFIEKWADEDLKLALDALTRPLTDAEKRSGKYMPPTAPRIALTGTYDQVQEFFTGDLSAFIDRAPIARWTDGLPVSPPTPEAVARMLKGTSRKPDEIVHPAIGPQRRPVTVEKVAINAVMAGCKPEYLPICLTMVETGLYTPWTSSGSMGILHMVSGPMVRELGMNAGTAFMHPGNPANETMGRFARLAIRNLLGIEHTVNLVQSYGTKLLGDILPESPDTPWEGLNVRYGFTAKDNVLLQISRYIALVGHSTGEATHITENLEAPGQLLKTVAMFQPSPASQGRFIMITPEQARRWKTDYKWNTMQELQEFLWKGNTWERQMYDTSYWWGSRLPFAQYVEALKNPRGSMALNPDHVEAPPTAQVPRAISPKDYVILVAGGGNPNYHVKQTSFSWGDFGTYSAWSIDKWK